MSLFGNAAGAGSGGSLFGGANNSNAGGNASGNTTGGSIFGAAPKPATSLFGGSSTPATGGGLFGGGSSTPAAPAATSNTGGGSIFGGGSAPAAGGGLFGAQPAAQNAPAATQPTGSRGVVFGQPSGGSSLFGAKPADASAPKPSLFGAPAATPAAGSNEAPKTNLFGGGGGGGSLFGKPAGSTPAPAASPAPAGSTEAPKPTGSLFGGGGGGSSLFGAPSSTGATPTQPAAPKPQGGSLFGTPAPAAASAPTTTTEAPKTSLFGSTPAAPSAPTTSLFGAPKPAGSTAAPSTSLFGAPAAKPEDKKDGTAPATTGTLSLTTAGGSGAPAAPAASISVQPPSMLKGKTIEDIVNRWTTDLELHVRDFNKLAGEVAVWDRALIENGNNLSAIYNHVLAAEREQSEVDEALNSIEQQQRDLLATLDGYGKSAQELAGTSGALRVTDKGPADMERDKNYMLAMDLQVQLDDLSSSLTEMITSVNDLSLPAEGSSSQAPMSQIAGILSSHLESLQWITGAVKEVESKVTDVEKKVKDAGHGQSLNSGPRGYGLR
ncbi:hypothetical protein CYLTODRAFT_406455 [Cylindrobasidium torrendii FP15055 ss-10]|uniref:Nucleoporin NSP1-like C-terminal domain-containing protein n=1 Tax=Cylindrobasidium torrendii FP15055 ss-10 TaxID=1314674 RepID=A0A0D7BU29_9AGAR|nr:hypothetical protein CYLTODRAFT_406455 [Cylindrobasidium torrendii FP15055 ss-10]